MAAKSKKLKCPLCSGTHIWKIGLVPARTGKKMRYKCAECARSFYAPPARATGKAKGGK